LISRMGIELHYRVGGLRDRETGELFRVGYGSVSQECKGLRDRLSDDRIAQDLSKGFLENVTIEELTPDRLTLLELAKKWDFEIPLGEAQNLMGQTLEECVGGLEKCWWENGTPKLFSPNLMTLAEKLGFNAERFLRITGPGDSASRS
jgi:hypothetical protein